MKATTLLETPPPNEEEGGGGGRGDEAGEDKAKRTTACGFQSHLELRLGISLGNGHGGGPGSDGNCGGGPSPRVLSSQAALVLDHRAAVGLGGTKRCYWETATGFVHPWSLAARLEKAALEHARQKPKPSIGSRAMHPPPPVVGWPPIRTFRKNLVNPYVSKNANVSTKNAEKTHPNERESMKDELEEKSTMFVKVNMIGYAVGRKIDLKIHDGYESLSSALQKMFHNFLSIENLKRSKENEQDENAAPNYILLYEDNEGDRMLVGDVPWQMFINTVKRLYITQDPRVKRSG